MSTLDRQKAEKKQFFFCFKGIHPRKTKDLEMAAESMAACKLPWATVFRPPIGTQFAAVRTWKDLKCKAKA